MTLPKKPTRYCLFICLMQSPIYSTSSIRRLSLFQVDSLKVTRGSLPTWNSKFSNACTSRLSADHKYVRQALVRTPGFRERPPSSSRPDARRSQESSSTQPDTATTERQSEGNET